MSSWQEVVACQINWRCQLRNGQGGSDEDNGNAGNKDDVETTTTTTTTTMAAESIRINAGTDVAAALCQGLTTRGKCSQHKR